MKNLIRVGNTYYNMDNVLSIAGWSTVEVTLVGGETFTLRGKEAEDFLAQLEVNHERGSFNISGPDQVGPREHKADT